VIFKNIGRAICWVIEGCGALVASAGVVCLYVSGLAWWKSGIWPSYDLQSFWDAVHSQWPHVEWMGMQKKIYLAPVVILKLPVWVAFLIVGGSIYILGLLGNLVLDHSMYTTKNSK
jgi:hypothetical protein